MICVSLAEPTLARCLAALDGIPFAEIRLDRMRTNEVEVARLFSGKARLVATCRRGRLPESRRLALLRAAIAAGAAYVDIEIGAGAGYKKALVRAARAAGCSVIISHHDFRKTPPREELLALVNRCFGSGADIAKIACRVRSPRDNARLLGLLDDERKLIVVGIGKRGVLTRIAGPLAGGVFSFASPGTGRETARGQIPYRTLDALIKAVADA